MKIKPACKTGGVLLELGPFEDRLATVESESQPAFGLKKILVPVDFSDCSKKALQYALLFAKQSGARLVLLHVVQPYPAVPEMAPVDYETIQDSKEQLEKLRRALGRKIEVAAVLRTGIPPVEIVDAAKELDIDLIIISTHGHKGFARLVLGSTTEKVVRSAPCPVLIVRQTERDFAPK
jgi:universal stress protein A